MKQRIRILSGKGTAGEKSVTPDEVIHLHGERDLSVLHDDKQQSKKVSNILQAMKREGTADVDGTGYSARWYLKK